MALLSQGFGATGTAIGQYQTTWRFRRELWDSSGNNQGGGGNAPSRLFSSSLWGTIVYPDEFIRLSPTLRGQILNPSPFHSITPNPPYIALPKWDSLKHLVYVIGSNITVIAGLQNARQRANAAITSLNQSLTIHRSIPFQLGDNTAAYQQNWLRAVNNLLSTRLGDYDYLDMLP